MAYRDVKCLWLPVRLSVLIYFVIFLSSGCMYGDRAVDRNANEGVQLDADRPSGGHLIEISSYEFTDGILVNEINAISHKLGLTPLSKTAPSESFEFRLWTNLGGLTDPRLLGIRQNRSDTNAYFFSLSKNENSVKSREVNLQSPKSKWNKMLFDLRNRLTTPKGLIRDPTFDLDRDEPVILLEVLDRGEYRRVFYGHTTSFIDGKRLFEVCNYLAFEFDVVMDCNRERITNP